MIGCHSHTFIFALQDAPDGYMSLLKRALNIMIKLQSLNAASKLISRTELDISWIRFYPSRRRYKGMDSLLITQDLCFIFCYHRFLRKRLRWSVLRASSSRKCSRVQSQKTGWAERFAIGSVADVFRYYSPTKSAAFLWRKNIKLLAARLRYREVYGEFVGQKVHGHQLYFFYH